MRKTIAVAALAAASLAGTSEAQSARDYISIVGSSTVYPFATVVAETFGKSTEFKTPKVESTGSGGGLKLFCEGIGVERPDIANSSRRIKSSEVERCAGNGVNDILEVKVGYDGIVFANSRKSNRLEISLRDLVARPCRRGAGRERGRDPRRQLRADLGGRQPRPSRGED